MPKPLKQKRREALERMERGKTGRVDKRVKLSPRSEERRQAEMETLRRLTA